MRGKYSARLVMPPSLRLAAGDPEDVAKGRQRTRCRVRIGALGVVDEQHVAAAADLLHAVRETGKLRRPSCRIVRSTSHRQRAGRGAGRVLRVVQAAQRADAAESCDFAARAAGGAHDGFALDIDAVGQRVLHGDAHHALAGLIEPVGDVAAPAVVDADDRACPAAARRRRAAPSPPRNAPACRGDRYGLR